MLAYLVDLVEESFVSTGSLTDNLEPVGRELVVVGGSLAFGELVDFSSDLHGRFERERESVVRLRLLTALKSMSERRNGTESVTQRKNRKKCAPGDP